MSEEKQRSRYETLSRWGILLLDFPWVEIIGKAWKICRMLLRGFASEGMYEVLDYESTLELLDSKGKKATFIKKMKIRYLQNEIIAFQDYGWGDGKILVGYKTNLGKAVDRYRSGYKTYILLSLRKVKNRGDVDEFDISWGILNGFLTKDGYWTTSVSHLIKKMQVIIIFPKQRRPLRVFLEETNHRKTRNLGDKYIKQLSDGRWQVTWKTNKLKLYENYVVRWDW